MPFSQSSQITTIVQFLEQLQPKSILDVGAGVGQYGFLARINLEHVNLFDQIDGECITQRPSKDWKIKIDGIEGFENYRTPVHDYVYNTMFYEDAMLRLPKISDNSYELVMAIDILEHFTKEKGIEFLQHLRRIASKTVLISTPKEFIHQQISGNHLEDHQSHWTSDELLYNKNSQILGNDVSWVVVDKLEY